MLTKRGVTIVELQRNIDLSNRSAWFLCQRIRRALRDDDFRDLIGIVESNADSAREVFGACRLTATQIANATK